MEVVSLKQLPNEMPLGNTGLTVAAAIAALGAAAAAITTDTLYRVDILQSTAENKIMNTLYYRFDSLIPLSWTKAGADNCAYQVEQEVIPLLRACLSNKQLIEAISVTPFSQFFERKLKNPHVEHVGLYGSRYAVDLAKSQRYAAKIRFNLVPNGFLGNIQQVLGLLPASGRVYIGALGHGDVGAAETISSSGLFTSLESLADKLADPLFNASPVGNFVPIRVRRMGFDVPDVFKPIVGLPRVNVYTAWSDVSSCQVDTEVTYLKSRQL